MQYGIRVIYKTLSLKRESCENRFSDKHIALEGVQCLPQGGYFPHSFTDFGETLDRRTAHNAAEQF
jgi:hypothetical protein